MKQTILVAGGAGYIGSHTVLELLQHHYRVVVVDKACSHQINDANVSYFQCDISHTTAIKNICTRYNINAVVHCAASIEVGASVVNPALYYENNVTKTLQFIESLRACSIKNIVFSSSAAVYGTPLQLPITETDICNPINPYGRTKLMVEQILTDYHTAYQFNSVLLRYFNAAGAYPEYNLGERHEPETHLIPRLLHAAHYGETFTLYGNDYETKDGTCVRDYVHVRDIARAHRLALEYLSNGGQNTALNLGTAHGFSVLEIITAVEQVVQKRIITKTLPRRSGDPAYLIADNQRAQTLLQWQPKQSDIISLVSSAYRFACMQQFIDRATPGALQQSHSVAVL